MLEGSGRPPSVGACLQPGICQGWSTMTPFRSAHRLPGLRPFAAEETAPVHLACHAASDGGTRDPTSIQASCENTRTYGKRTCGMLSMLLSGGWGVVPCVCRAGGDVAGSAWRQGASIPHGDWDSRARRNV